ncbi:uncharacterized protein LOC121369633 isoform X2 [Gigantopelta aegis]|uniref:uncharacterized protein LOC121369633 isoform X2 n=1 Tax=Gigantopelta aegis TaxID=1735272 RepID=UPI001B88B4FB|nr:uncharacterized protein LOC121369633 isoform X2 [Gigantopelta aegis]
MASNGPESTAGPSVVMIDNAQSGDLGATGAHSFTIHSSTSKMDEFVCDTSSYQTKDSLEKAKHSSPVPKPFLELAHSKDIKDPSALYGSCGLYNLGNTCFMNAGLQCVMASSPLVKFFLEEFTLDTSVKDTLMGRFYMLLCKVWCGQYTVIYPNRFKDTLGLYHSQFQDYRQHDCQEFLALLLDTLHEQLSMTGSNLRCLPSNNTPASGAGSCTALNPVINSLNNMDTSPPKISLESSVNSQSPSDNSKLSQSALICPVNSKTYQSALTSSANSKFSQSDVSSVPTDQLENNSIPQVQDNKLLETNNTVPCGQSENNVILQGQDKIILNGKGSDPQLSSSGESSLTDGILSLTEHPNTPPEEIASGVLSDAEHALNLKRLKLQAENSACVSSSPSSTSSCDSMMQHDTVIKPVEQSNNIRLPTATSASSPLQTDLGGKNVIYSSPDSKSGNLQLNNSIRVSKLPPDLLDFYCKESKTLNTNVLINEYSEEFVSTDSEKFAKQDNRFHMQSEENSILQEAVGMIDEDKNDKDPSGSSFGIKDVNLHANKKKSRLISKSCTNVLKMDYTTGEYGMNNFKRIKMESTDSVEKCDMEQELSKDDTEEKNIQIQALSKFNTCRNISDEASDNESCDSMEVEGDGFVADLDSSEDEETITSINSIPTGALASAPKHQVCSQHDIDAADKAWEDYIADNNSIVVQSFQGQFKSTVVCFGCHHMSVMYEPFMYLSLPIPRAMERQICVIFVPSNLPPVRYLLNMNKHDNIEKLKKELLTVISRHDCDIILAEVLESHISRILDDNILLRYVNDSSRKIYAFEIISPAPDDHSNHGHPVETSSSSQVDISTDQETSTDTGATTETDIFSHIGTFSVSETTSHALFTDSKPDDSDILVEMQEPDVPPATTDAPPVVPSMSSIDLAESWLGLSEGTDTSTQSKYEHEDLAGTGMWEWSCVGLEAEPQWDQADATKKEESPPPGVASGGTPAAIVDQWRSCAICLEELSDSDLLVHSCSGTFCQSCLEMSMKHSSNTTYCCPICLSPASVVDDFLPLANSGNHKAKQRVIAIPVAFRHETSDKKLHLFGHPNILYVANHMTGRQVYEKVDALLPYPVVYTIVLTDGQGLHCSRCIYTAHCSGCALDREGEVTLQPSDHLTVQVQNILDDQIEDVERIHEDESMENLRQNEQITIYDCFRAFTQSEVLDEHNPWYCPQCKQNQCAKKTMTVWRYPDWLIVHLKRFVFHEFSSLKIDDRVIYPHKNLDLRDFISGPATKDLTYDLYSIVCHFGGAHSGHYSSYSRHPLTSEWFYYNDDTITQQTPREDDFSSAYVLFYERQGTHSEVQPSMCLPKMVLEEESVDPTYGPQPSEAPFYGPQPSEGVVYGPQTFDAASCRPQPFGPQPSGHRCSDEGGFKTESKTESSFDFYS